MIERDADTEQALAKGAGTTIQVADDQMIRQRLLAFERQRHMWSLDFFRRYNAGLEDDREENVEWIGWCHMAIAAGLFPPTGSASTEPAKEPVAG